MEYPKILSEISCRDIVIFLEDLLTDHALLLQYHRDSETTCPLWQRLLSDSTNVRGKRAVTAVRELMVLFSKTTSHPTKSEIKKIILSYWPDIPEDKLRADIETYYTEEYTETELIEMFELLEMTDTEGE